MRAVSFFLEKTELRQPRIDRSGAVQFFFCTSNPLVALDLTVAEYLRLSLYK
jgi:hypothetical protein